MRILISQPNDLNKTNYFMGFAEALADSEHTVSVWHPNAKPTFDMFDEFSPELLIIDSEQYDDSVEKCLSERPLCKVAVCENTDKKYDFNFNQQTIRVAANIVGYNRPKRNKMFETELLYIGKYNPILDKLCHHGRQVKFFGEKVRSEYSLGNISKESIPDAFYSARAVLHIYDSLNHTSQQIYDALFCKGFVISNIGYEYELEKENPCIYWLNNLDKARRKEYNDDEILEESRQYIFKFHTYYDRCIELFKGLDLDYTQIEDGKTRYANERL